MIFALIGNQNSGKTTLFNQLTGSNQHVGNFPGVTVEKKEGSVIRNGKRQKDLTVVDLPGIYSLSPYTSEEVVTRDFLIKDKPDGIINIVDATNIERNLYLSLQLMELQIPMVIALNMMDEVRANEGSIDIQSLQAQLGVPVVPIAAIKREGLEELCDRFIEISKNKIIPKKMDFCVGEVHKAIHALAHIIEEQAKAKGIPVKFAATKLIEGDELMVKSLQLTENESDIIGHIVDDMEKALKTDREAALADMRYEYIERICYSTVIKNGDTKEQLRSLKIDNLLTHKYLAIPIFLLIMYTIFAITFGVLGPFFSGLFSVGINFVTDITDKFLTDIGVNEVMQSLVIHGIFAGVGSVLSFMPIILILFFFLSLLEDSGYMARVAFVMDKLLRKIGLSGKSIVPMLIGFGCSVPAIMATRTLASERDRKMTIMLIPFMSCSAKLPIYAVFAAAFFKQNQALVMIVLYVTGIIIGILSALILKKSIFKGNPIPFIMELPAYRMPSVKSVGQHIWEKAKDFIIRAFTIIFIATIAIWFFQSFDFRFNLVSDSKDSILAFIGKLITPVFTPMGFNDWRAATALIAGVSAKEAVISTLAILTGAANTKELINILPEIFSPLAAFSFLIFTLLYTPCVAAIAAVKRELGGIKGALVVVIYQILIAWVVSVTIYQTGNLIF